MNDNVKLGLVILISVLISVGIMTVTLESQIEPQGEQGLQGVQGVQGIQGIRGEEGTPGLPGNPGPSIPISRQWRIIETREIVNETVQNYEWRVNLTETIGYIKWYGYSD